MKPILPVLMIAAASLLGGVRVHAETAFFLMSGPRGKTTAHDPKEAYVVAVSDPALIKQARDFLKSGQISPWLVPNAGIAPGSDGVNRNHAEPGHPEWPWHTTGISEWVLFDPDAPRVDLFLLEVDGNPSDVPDMLAGNLGRDPVNSMSLVNYPLVAEFTPGVEGKVGNVSTRGWVGAGERILIAGIIVEGTQPRNVIVRGIGPSLAQFDISEPLTNPKITIFHGSDAIAENDDWRNGNLLPEPPETPIAEPQPPFYAFLFPLDQKEAAIKLSLLPGAYTVHLTGIDDASGEGAEGIGLVEVFDLDALAPRQ